MIVTTGVHPLALPTPAQWTPQASLPQIPITSAVGNPLNPTLLPPTIGAPPFDPSVSVGSNALWRSEYLPASQAVNLSQSIAQIPSTPTSANAPVFNTQPLTTAPGGLAAYHVPSAAALPVPAAPTTSLKEDPLHNLPVSQSGLLPTLSSCFQVSNVLASQSQLATSYSPGQQVIAQGTGQISSIFSSQVEKPQERFLQLQKIMDKGGTFLPSQNKICHSSIESQAGTQVPGPSIVTDVSGPNEEGGLVLQPPAIVEPPASSTGVTENPEVEYPLDCQLKIPQGLPSSGNSTGTVAAVPVPFIGSNAALRDHIPSTPPADPLSANHNGTSNT